MMNKSFSNIFQKTLGEHGKYVWVNGVINGGENVLKDQWEDNEPKPRNGRGAAIMASSSHNKWSTRKFDQQLSFVCEKPQGSFCQFGLQLKKGHCYDFWVDPNIDKIPWEVASKTCDDYGLQMIVEEDRITDDFITKQLYKSGIFSQGNELNGMWLGYKGRYLYNNISRLSDFVKCIVDFDHKNLQNVSFASRNQRTIEHISKCS